VFHIDPYAEATVIAFIALAVLYAWWRLPKW
jgi:hypothetical protein